MRKIKTISENPHYQKYHFESREVVLVGIRVILKSVDLLNPL